MSVAAVGGAVVGGIMAGDAASAAASGSKKAIAEQKRQFDLTRQDNKPWMEAGSAGVNELSYLLGLSPYGAGGNAAPSYTREQLREQLLPQFTTSNVISEGKRPTPYRGINDELGTNFFANRYSAFSERNPTPATTRTSTINEAGLAAEIEKRLAAQQQTQNDMRANAATDPRFGSLLKQYDANAFWNDDATQLGLEFGMNEGRKGIDRMAAATGGVQNGKTLKALQRFGTDYMSTKFNEGFNRDQVNKNSTYNKLAGISGSGQQATQFVGSAGSAMAGNVGNMQVYGGEARGAGSIGVGNALTKGMENIYGMGKQSPGYSSASWDSLYGSGYSGPSYDAAQWNSLYGGN